MTVKAEEYSNIGVAQSAGAGSGGRRAGVVRVQVVVRNALCGYGWHNGLGTQLRSRLRDLNARGSLG